MKTIKWGDKTDNRNPLGNSSLSNLPWLVSDFRHGRAPFGWHGNQVFDNRYSDLPPRAYGYYKDFYQGASPETSSARVVLGQGGEIYVTGSNHRDFIQILYLPAP